MTAAKVLDRPHEMRQPMSPHSLQSRTFAVGTDQSSVVNVSRATSTTSFMDSTCSYLHSPTQLLRVWASSHPQMSKNRSTVELVDIPLQATLISKVVVEGKWQAVGPTDGDHRGATHSNQSKSSDYQQNKSVVTTTTLNCDIVVQYRTLLSEIMRTARSSRDFQDNVDLGWSRVYLILLRGR